MKTAKLPRCYYDFQDMLRTNPSGNVPYTPILPLLYAMKESLSLLKEEGFENTVKRHHRLAEGVRKAVAAWGLELLCKNPRWRSDSLTVVEVPPGIDSGLVVKNAYSRYNLSIGVGLSQVQGKVFRIGHLGNMDEVRGTSRYAPCRKIIIIYNKADYSDHRSLCGFIPRDVSLCTAPFLLISSLFSIADHARGCPGRR